jgi:hypothetical protein
LDWKVPALRQDIVQSIHKKTDLALSNSGAHDFDPLVQSQRITVARACTVASSKKSTIRNSRSKREHGKVRGDRSPTAFLLSADVDRASALLSVVGKPEQQGSDSLKAPLGATCL